ncbi:MAG: FIST C-terminal domain-containing protein [Verrucomicrobia bacterium]|nr:FIST C-terminal domain-containing protein [Verrucomicrobiota bacterium]
MRISAAITSETDVDKIAVELCEHVRAQLGAAKVDLALLFVSPRFVGSLPDLVEDIHLRLGARHLVGCTGGGIIGEDREVEGSHAVALWAASLPGVTVQPFRITQQQVEESNGPAFWHSELGIGPEDEPSLILLPDPFSTDAARMVEELSAAYPGRPLVGGLASGARQAGENRVWINEEVFEDGAVGVALCGAVRLRAIVSQGCRPIGEPLIVTKAQRNVIVELASQPPVVALQETLKALSEQDRQLAQQALFVGRVINEYQAEFHRGDFLIRNIVGLDPNNGAIAIGDREIRSGQTIQFQLRDGATANEDLRELIEKQQSALAKNPPEGALLFSCLGRGKNLFGKPNHDVSVIRETIGPLPLAGFFCNGEIGPIGDKTFVHGFTSVLALFEPIEKGN